MDVSLSLPDGGVGSWTVVADCGEPAVVVDGAVAGVAVAGTGECFGVGVAPSVTEVWVPVEDALLDEALDSDVADEDGSA
ncbi:MAG: hypothetical protein P4L86_21075 [Mycobacterium sp.]|nr:hypothetical protein [Mycobacterium sp.]